MNFEQNINLSNLTTMKVGSSKARLFKKVSTKEDIQQVYQYAKENNLPVYILGEGSNSLATDTDYEGIVVKNELRGIEKKELNENEVLYKVSSGEIWDDFVRLATQDGMTGIEATSGIPGTAGATPVQNVGAYGQEIADVLIEAEVYDSVNNEFKIMQKADFGFGYRTSTLKRAKNKQYFVLSVTYKLQKGQLSRPFYWSLEQYVTNNNLTDFSPAKIAKYVKEVRDTRIPDYKQYPSSGSFFENAEILPAKFEEIKTNFPDIPYGAPQPNGLVKIPTAWMIEKTGLPGQIINGIEITKHNPMILVNKDAKTYQDLQTAKNVIIKAVEEKFGITLEQEPIEIK